MSGRNSPRDSAGYVLFGVLVGITLLGVGLSAAVTLWGQVVQREREAELLFRGEAIVRGLERFQQDRPGTLPETLDELVEGKYLRRAWVDPMTGRSFRILRAENALASGASGPRRRSPGQRSGAHQPSGRGAPPGRRRRGTRGTGRSRGRRRNRNRDHRGGEHQRPAQFPGLRGRPPLQRVAVRGPGGSHGCRRVIERGETRPGGRRQNAEPGVPPRRRTLAYPRRANASSPARGQVLRST